MKQPLLSVEHLRVEFGTPANPIVVVDDVSFEIEAGGAVGIVGEIRFRQVRHLACNHAAGAGTLSDFRRQDQFRGQ